MVGGYEVVTMMSIHSYQTLIGELRAINFNPHTAESFLKKIDRSVLCQVLSEILRENHLLLEVASKSYIHQLGFHKYILGIVPEAGIWLRLHYWPEDINSEDEDVHDHCAPFVSHVMRGELGHKIYKITSGNKFFEYQYCFDEATQKGQDISCGRINITHTDNMVTSAGMVYFMSDDVLHKVNVAKQGTVTLSLWGRRTKNARVIRYNEANKKIVRKSGMTIEAARQNITKIINLLSYATCFKMTDKSIP